MIVESNLSNQFRHGRVKMMYNTCPSKVCLCRTWRALNRSKLESSIRNPSSFLNSRYPSVELFFHSVVSPFDRRATWLIFNSINPGFHFISWYHQSISKIKLLKHSRVHFGIRSCCWLRDGFARSQDVTNFHWTGCNFVAFCLYVLYIISMSMFTCI